MFAGRLTKSQMLGSIKEDVTLSKMAGTSTLAYVTTNKDAVIRYHQTDVLRHKSNGDYVLDSGGYRTPTTKNRMNDNCNGLFQIGQEKGIWWLYVTGRDRVEFFDGMVIGSDGSVVKQGRESYNARRTDAKHRKQIKAYCDKLKKVVDEGTLPKPSEGDCWVCMMEQGHPDDSTDNGHIESHLQEKYIHGTLIVNALLWAGYRMEQMPLVYGDWRTVSTVRRYLKHRMGLPS